MKNRKKSAIALALCATLATGIFAGCDIVTTDTKKDMEQVVAVVDITANDDFQSGGRFEKYSEVIQPSYILKRDLYSLYVTTGYQYTQSGQSSYAETYSMIMDTLTNNQILLQYAMVYFFENGWTDEDANIHYIYTPEEYLKAVDGDYTETARAAVGLEYFLNDTEIKRAQYNVKRAINNSIDSIELSNFIDQEETTSSSDSSGDTRTLPTGVNTSDSEYLPEVYEIYTGTNSASACGEYEVQEGSTSYTRSRAYKTYLSNMLSNNMLYSGERTDDITKLSYYIMQVKSAYETALIQRLQDAFGKEIEATITAESVTKSFNDTLQTQKSAFENDNDQFESALDNVSDSNFVLTAPNDHYGFVINILIPFSDMQKATLNTSIPDGRGNKFVARAQLLKAVRGTDQRGTWFTGSEDYSFDASTYANAYRGYNNDTGRNYLFFEDCIGETTEYEPLAKYYGNYTYNGSVSYDNGKKKYTLQPNAITVDQFLMDMEGYLKTVEGITVSGSYQSGGALSEAGDASYYQKAANDYYTTTDKGKQIVNYEKFVYYTGKVTIDGQERFDMNKLFVPTSKENQIMSVINELSFAYNTDTAGLNSYLGYAVSPNKTEYMSEFEYAAQLAVQGGAGTYTVAPTDYGWHIMYCTFSYHDKAADAQSPYAFNAADIKTEGTFSNLYFEATKNTVVSNHTSARTTEAINYFASNSTTVYEERYKDLILD